MTRINAVVSALFFVATIGARQAKIEYVDFDTSMQLRSNAHVLKDQPGQINTYAFFKVLYEHNNPLKLEPTDCVRIPKKIHQIWLGSAFPEKYHAFAQSWIAHHPGWEYKLWTEKDLATFAMKNRAMFDSARNYGEKADIWRYEILEQFGGVYIDIDFECLKPLDIFNYTYDLYVGIQPLDTNFVQLGIGLIGAIPHHPVLQYTIEALKKNAEVRQIIVRTGPIHFTKSFIAVAGKTPGLRDIALPATYFYPCGYDQRGMKRENWIKDEAYAVHHWAGSWLEPQAFVK